VVGSLKLLGAERIHESVPTILRMMGQDILNPPTVKGWDGGTGWINATTVVARFNYANRLAVSRGQGGESYLEPQALAAKYRTPEALVAYFSDLLLDDDLPAAGRAALLEYASEAADYSGDADAADRKVRGLAHLAMASPVYQLN
jgi:hypothetical protein